MATILQLMIVCMMISSAAYADIYKYTDASGSICITNNLEKVPRKYRGGMTVIKEDAPAREKLLPETNPAPAVQAVMPQTELMQKQSAPTENKNRYINTALVIAGLIAVYFILGKITAFIGFQRIGTVMFLLVVLAGGACLYNMYIEELRSVFGTLRNDARNIQKNVEKREVKTDQMLKQLE